MSVVYKFNRADYAVAMESMGFVGAPSYETTFNRTASIILGNGIGESSLQRAAVTIQHEAADRTATVGRYLDRHRHRTDVAEAKAAGSKSAVRVGAKVSNEVRDALVAGGRVRDSHN